jgi:hypothetical protein
VKGDYLVKLKQLSVFTLVSAVFLFLLIMPAFASDGKSCTTTSDGTQTCIAETPSGSSGEGSSPGSPGTGIHDPGTGVILPIPGIPMEKTIPVNPADDKPVEVAPDANVPEGTITPSPADETPAIAEDSISVDDGIRYFATNDKNIQAAAVGDLTIGNIGWVGGLTVVASLCGAVHIAFRSKKNRS